MRRRKGAHPCTPPPPLSVSGRTRRLDAIGGGGRAAHSGPPHQPSVLHGSTLPPFAESPTPEAPTALHSFQRGRSTTRPEAASAAHAHLHRPELTGPGAGVPFAPKDRALPRVLAANHSPGLAGHPQGTPHGLRGAFRFPGTKSGISRIAARLCLSNPLIYIIPFL